MASFTSSADEGKEKPTSPMVSRRWPGDGAEQKGEGLPHGYVLGVAKCGVIGYNCNYKNMPDKETYDGSNFHGRVFLGAKWQCVEYARRYWYLIKNVLLPPVSFASHIWDIPYAAEVGTYRQVPLLKYPNGGTEPPKEGDLLIYKSTPNQWVGHVGVVAGVRTLDDGNVLVEVIEQNNDNDELWKYETHSQELIFEASKTPFPPISDKDETAVKSVVSSDPNATYYLMTHPDEDLILEGLVRLDLDNITPRPAWSPPNPPLDIPTDGVYSVETVKALQRFMRVFADGSHGGMTNSALRGLIKEYGHPDDAPASTSNDDLLLSLRKFLVRLSGLTEMNLENVVEDHNCNRIDCVCHSILSHGRNRSGVNEGEACATTVALQKFLKLVTHPHDIHAAHNAIKDNAPN